MAIAVQSVPLYCSFILYTGSSPGWDVIMVLKSSRPSLPLKKAPPFSPSLSSIVFATPSVPLLGDRNPQGREDVTALRCSEPLRYKVGGPSKVCARLCGLGPPGGGILNCFVLLIKHGGCLWLGWLYRSQQVEN